ncbi:hypothetical protein AB0B28_21140 [Glycomyces sp. NPDC046736]|uniref:hypothetical protein n=1 Tax=Glycomyces sp. NPDC046736 TaxID=3155615 RepID=UPI0033E00115
MTVPSNTPTKPGAITAAAVLIWLQLAFVVCCGFMPIFLWVPAFIVEALDTLPIQALGGAVWLVLAAVFIGSVLYTALTTIRLGKGDRRGRPGTIVGFIAILVLTSIALFPSYTSAATFASAAPSVICQLIACMCVYSPAAERWFRECEQYSVAPGP